MATILSNTVPDRSLKYVRACIQFSKEYSESEAIDQCVDLAGQFLNSNLTLFLSEIETNVCKVISSNELHLKGEYLEFPLNNFDSISLEQKSWGQVELKERFFENTEEYLIIPVREDIFSGAIIFFYNNKLTINDDIINFAELIQEIIREKIKIININSVPKKRDTLSLHDNEGSQRPNPEQNLVLRSLKQLSSLFKGSFSGIMVFKSIRSKDGKIRDFECLFSIHAEKFLFDSEQYDFAGKNILNILPKNLANDLIDQFYKVVETGEAMLFEHAFDRKKDIVWSQTMAAKLEDGFLVTFLDITDRKNTEVKQKHYMDDLDALLQSTNELIWSVDKNLKITAINSSFQNLLSQNSNIYLSVGDVIPMSFFSHEEVTQWKKFYTRSFLGETFSEEVLVKNHEINYIYEFTFFPIKVKNDEIIGSAIFGRDISKRISNQQEIRQKSQLLNSLLQNLPILIFAIDENGNVTKPMGAALKKLNRLTTQFPEANAQELFEEIKTNFRKSKTVKSINFMSSGTNGGEMQFFDTYIFPDEINSGGGIGFAIDVTERIHIEREIKRAKESAERANQAKNFFLANMSHDLRTPIHTILGFAEILKGRTKTFESLNFIHYIISSGEMLYKLVDDILELTKIEEGKLELKEESFHLKEVLSSNLHPYQFQANEKGLNFELYFDESLPEYVVGDAGKISRIIINLLGNSLKFTNRGFINISFACLNHGNKDECKQIKVVVTDTGSGISKEKHDLIFNSFTQAEPSINNIHGGSGLGLAIVKELVNLMNGTCGVESPINKNLEIGDEGSAFWIVLPLEEGHPVKTGKANKATPELINYNGNLKVLVVEDNPINQQLVKVMLLKLGCSVTLCDNGKDSIEKLHSNSYDLILMDVQMPVMGGIEATRYFRKHFTKKLPIIGLSANVYKDDITKCLESGMDDYLGKPFSEKELQEKIFKWAKLNFKVNKQDQPLVQKKLFDLSFLINLFNGDQNAVKGMVEDFCAYHRQMIEQMELEFANKNYENILSISHNMRSSITTVGLNSLMNILLDLEKTAKDEKMAYEISEKIKKIKEISHKAIEQLKDAIEKD